MEFDKEIFAENLRALRARRRMSQESLGRAIGVPGNTIFNYENSINTPGADKLCLLAEVLDTTPNDLIGWK